MSRNREDQRYFWPGGDKYFGLSKTVGPWVLGHKTILQNSAQADSVVEENRYADRQTDVTSAYCTSKQMRKNAQKDF